MHLKLVCVALNECKVHHTFTDGQNHDHLKTFKHE